MTKIVLDKINQNDAQDAFWLRRFDEELLHAWWCPDCGVRNVSVSGEGYEPFCNNCGFTADWYDLAPIYLPSEIEVVRMRDPLRDLCVIRQDDICVVCGHGMYGDSAVHEAIVKRGDLPGDPRVFVVFNCVAIHNRCHENTKEVDKKCMAYLAHEYGLKVITDYLLWLDFKEIPGRASEILEMARFLESDKTSSEA